MKFVRAVLQPMAMSTIFSIGMFAQTPPKVFISAADVHCSSLKLGCSGSSTTPASMEIVNKFQNDCPAVKVVSAAPEADYLVSFSHFQVNLFRDNQFSVANHNGDVLNFHTGLSGSVRGNIKRACKIVTEDWKQKSEASSAHAATPAHSAGAQSIPSTEKIPSGKPCRSLWNDASGHPICTSALDDSGHTR